MMGSGVTGGNRMKSQTLRGVDPDTCMMVFKNHWTQVLRILDKHEPSRCGAQSFFSGLSGATPGAGGGGGVLRLPPIPSDEASAVHNYVEHMLYLLMEEEPGRGGAMGPILELVVVEGVMERLFLWSLRRQLTVELKLEQLRMYQMLLGHAHQPLLHHKPILKPLMVLLASCAGSPTGRHHVEAEQVQQVEAEQVQQVEAELVSLLQQLCVSVVRDPAVLEMVFHSTQDQGAADFLLFSLLIPYTHRSVWSPQVLATGLSGLYSALPGRLQVYSEDWHCLEEADWLQVPALVHFLHSLEFCSAVIKVAHPSIRCQLLGYIYNGFLVPVLAPALHKLSVEEVMTTTAYLDVSLRRASSEPPLLHSFLTFIFLHTHDQTTLHPHRRHTSRGAGVSEGHSVYCGSSDSLVHDNYLHYLWEARRAISMSTRACQTWSAPYDGFRPLTLEEEEGGAGEGRGGGQGGEEGEELTPERRCRAAAPPSPTDPVAAGDLRGGSCIPSLELEWEDMFKEDHRPSMLSSLPGATRPPRHIQELQRSATALLRGGGAYAEDSDFQDDVLVYNLVALRDARTPTMLEPDTSQLANSDLITFRRRVHALRRRQEEEGLEEEVDFSSWKEEEQEEEQEEEEERSTGHRKQNTCFTGPFLSVLLSRLENLLENSISVNLLLTGILSQLASYPQPLLRGFLLNTHTQSTHTLYQVLSSVRVQIENYVTIRPDYVSMVTQAWTFLLAKDQRVRALPPCPPMEPLDRSRVFAIILFGEFLKELAALAQEHSLTP
ncbi:hypothetical protein CRUP_008686 [Coryphaenoides rupestris]|nr:hypothetical protein CRUP_008686 [Coryphaenoides rupestris]